MKKLLIMLMGVAVMAAAVSCKKKKKNEDGPGTNVAKLLTGTKWKVTAQTISPAADYNADGVPDTDLMALRPECMQDDYVVFSDGGAFQFYEGTKKCTETVHAPGTWVLYNNNKSLRITDEDGSFEAEIVSISATTLTYKYTEVVGGKTVTVTETRAKS